MLIFFKQCYHIDTFRYSTGTGTNAAFVESTKNVETLGGLPGSASHVAINTEWGAFGERSELEFIRTYYDRILDDNSPNPDHQMQVLFKRINIHDGCLRKLTTDWFFSYEKMISGLYIGELVRYVLLDLTCKELLFHGNFPSFLNTNGSFKSLFISEIERLVEDTIYIFS